MNSFVLFAPTLLVGIMRLDQKERKNQDGESLATFHTALLNPPIRAVRF
jgi:hypothetical protein